MSITSFFSDSYMSNIFFTSFDYIGDEKEVDSSPDLPIIDKSNLMQVSMGPSTSTASLCMCA